MTDIDFLFEIGTEEIPAGYISNAIEKLKESFSRDLKDYKLDFIDMFTYSTPRRLAIKIIGLDSSQEDETVEKTGPAKKVALDENGQLTKAGIGFLKGAGAEEKDIFILETTKGDYIAVKVFLQGKKTEELLPQMMKNAIERIIFPKTMKWGAGNFMFARPIRWMLALYNENQKDSECLTRSKIIDFDFEGVKTGNISFGNRFEGLENKIEILSPDEYPEALKKVKIIADRAERKEMIISQILKHKSDLNLFSENDTIDEKLLDTVTDLVEYPTAVIASFSKEYLDLPAKIITSTLSQNQKYFTIQDKNGNLSNDFIFISNGDPSFSDIIRIGNEKVVKARLDDAKFYFQEDTKIPFEDYVQKLGDVVFQAQLGNMLEKTERVVDLCIFLCAKLIVNKNAEETKQNVLRAAHLAKADLVTLMLGEKEFTVLQGYIGMNYARLSGENSEVAQAIYEHYMPRGQKDDLPSEITSAILAIADKLDTVCGIIGIGLIPTGSADPYAIRRAANGIVQIIDKYGFDLSLKEIIICAFERMNNKLISNNQLQPKTLDIQEAIHATLKYFKQRIKWLLEELYLIEYDVLDALDIFEWDSVINIKNRAIALQSLKKQENIDNENLLSASSHTKAKKDFEILVSGFKRVSNILDKNKIEIAFNPELLKEENEIILYKHLHKINLLISPLLEKMAYREVLETIVPIGSDIDAFFDKVLVMCEDLTLRNNRLALLKEIKAVFLKVADISKID
ncbi:MAG: glycine--tRNA ligase subunit beta [Candidatus Cloacimonetes bacterium]|nr:glycine--tRNA ligase subunit beta [Candidatus Cloacimonadota bacterium]